MVKVRHKEGKGLVYGMVIRPSLYEHCFVLGVCYNVCPIIILLLLLLLLFLLEHMLPGGVHVLVRV